MNPTTSCFLCRETHRKQHTTWTRFDLNRPPYWMFEQHQCCFNVINKVHVCSLALINVKDLIHKKFTCLCDNMEIYSSITYVEPFLPSRLPGVQNRKRHWNMTLPSSLVNRPFYRYGGHIELIRFKEYYRMPRGHEHISFVFSAVSVKRSIMSAIIALIARVGVVGIQRSPLLNVC